MQMTATEIVSMILFLRLGVRTISFTVISPDSFSHFNVSLIDWNSTSVAGSF